MAIFKSQIATQISGSVGGTTYAHNKSGMYMRARSIPVQPNSTAQNEVKNALTQLVNAYQNVLTPAQRAAWELYAQNVPVVNKLGDSVNNSGQNWYIGANVPRLQAITKLGFAGARVDDAPTTYNRGDFSAPSIGFDETAGMSNAFTNTDDWAGEDGAAMFVYQGAPQSGGRTFYKGPWRLIGMVEGDSGTPPTSPNVTPAAILDALGYPITTGQFIWAAVAVSRADGRLSTRRNFGPIEVT